MMAAAVVAPELIVALAPSMWTMATINTLVGVGMMGASTTLSGIADALRQVPGSGVSVKTSSGTRQVIYGEMRVSGTLVYSSQTTDHHDLHKVIVWASHPCQSIDVLYVDGREVHLQADGTTASGYYYDSAGNKYTFCKEGSGDNPRLWAYNHLGSASGHWFSELYARDSRWTSDHTLNGIAATHIVFRYNSDIYAGDPSVKAAIHGKCDIYDPRLGDRLLADGATLNPAAHVYTNNAALCIADVLTNSDFGVGCSWDEIDIPQLIAAANLSDELVPLANGLSEKRYTINGVCDYSQEPGDIVQSMLDCCEGRLTYTSGKFQIYPAAWYGTSLQFDAGDIVGPVKWTPTRKGRELFNAVRGVYTCPVYPYAVSGYDRNHKNDNIWSGEYQPTDAPEYACDSAHGYVSDTYLAQDGRKLYQDRRYQFVTSCGQVQRLMKIYMLRNRQQGSGLLQMSMAAYQVQAQDVIKVSFPALNWDGKWLEVQSFRFVPKLSKDGGEAPVLYCEMDIAETDPSIYTWSTAEERTVENLTSPAQDNIVDPVTALALTSDITTASITNDGLVTPRIKATWIQPADTFVSEGGTIQVSYRLTGAASWTNAGTLNGQDMQLYIPAVAGLPYDVQVIAVRGSGKQSAAVTASITVPATLTNALASTGEMVTNGTFNGAANWSF